MRARVLVLVASAGCNPLLGLDDTKLRPDAGDVAGITCTALPYDPLRYRPSPPMSLTYEQGRALCQSIGMDLGVLDEGDPDELSHELAGAPAPFWEGVAFVSGKWTAIDGCRPYFSWIGGMPTEEVDTDCVRVDATGMVSRNCSLSQDETGQPIAALCETPRPSADCQAHATGMYSANHGSFAVPYANANTFCPAGYHIVEIDSSAELGMAMSVASANSAVPFWAGVQYAASSNTWSSVTGCPAVFAWASNEPNLSAGACVIVDADGMHMHDCSDPNTGRVLCEQD